MLFSSEQIIHIFDTEEVPREGSQSQPPPQGGSLSKGTGTVLEVTIPYSRRAEAAT